MKATQPPVSLMYVTKRNGQQAPVAFDKIRNRAKKAAEGLQVDFYLIAKKVIDGLFDGVSTRQLDDLMAETAASMALNHPDYTKFASRVAISAYHKETDRSFTRTMKRLYQHKNADTQEPEPLVSEEFYRFVQKHGATVEAFIDYDRDYLFDYFGFCTLRKQGYLLGIDAAHPFERPQHLYMRVALAMWGDNLEDVRETYEFLSTHDLSHATPTLLNAGTLRQQLSSCFLLTIKDDSVDGIYDTLKDTAKISQAAGGIGLAISNVRAEGARIRTTGSKSTGIKPMIKVFNDTARYIDQGGRRKGAFAMYLEPWHADTLTFLEMKLPHGKEENRARDLFYALWIPDLFWRRYLAGENWTFFSPDEAPGLQEAWDATFEGGEFTELYERYEREGRGRSSMPAATLLERIIDAQTESGTPYMLNKDQSNRKSNQQNLGTIKSSNLCTEILQYTDIHEIAVCNLASLPLPRYVKKNENGTSYFDHQQLYTVTKRATRNLNRVIDVNFYPVPEAERSNRRHRPVGMGPQGLADAFALLGLPFDSLEARILNREISETMYFAALEASMEEAQLYGAYETYQGSPVSKGILQFDMWEDAQLVQKDGQWMKVSASPVATSGRWDWATLRAQVAEHGVRNSLLIAPMPTASTASILGNNESFEPYTTNVYTRRTLSGEYIMVNSHLVRSLEAEGLWSPAMKNAIVAADGSIQKIEAIPARIKALYKTVWEIPQRVIIDQAADRGAFVCQSQSMNLHIPYDPKAANQFRSRLRAAWVYGTLKGLKTLSYYIRTTAATTANKKLGNAELEPVHVELPAPLGRVDDEGCEMCSA